MLDSVRVQSIVKGVDPAAFSGVSGSSIDGYSTARLFHNEGGISTTYYPASESINVEFSFCDVGGIHQDNMSAAITEAVINQVNQHLKRFGIDQDVNLWRVRRLDYAYNWQIGQAIKETMSVLQSLNLTRYNKTTYPAGVMWAAGCRSLKFYDKAVQSQSVGCLRFEVHHKQAAIDYMAAAAARPTTLESLRDYDFAAQTLNHWLGKLGLSKEISTQDSILYQLYSVFGTRTAMAHWVLHLMTTLGAQAYKEPQFVSASAYYEYKKELFAHGFVVERDGKTTVNTTCIAPLRVPRVVEGQNLETPTAAPARGVKLVDQISSSEVEVSQNSLEQNLEKSGGGAKNAAAKIRKSTAILTTRKNADD